MTAYAGSAQALRRRASERLADAPALAVAVVAALTVVAAALRLAGADQGLFGDELLTYWNISTHDLPGVVSYVHTDVEVTPPLYFMASWLTTRIDLTNGLARAPSLAAGIAAVPLIYMVGLRTVGRRAAIVAAALMTLSPLMIYYSVEARGYELMLVLVLGSTLAMLRAVDGGRARWWVVYGACSCAAVYTHYTGAFALAGQLLWLLWAHPEARRPALLANTGALVGFLPWLPSLKADLDSPTIHVLDQVNPFTGHFVRLSLEHWAIGYPAFAPNTRLPDVPGVTALVLLGIALAVAVTGAFVARPRLGRRLALVIVLAASVPVGEALSSAVGSNILGPRNMAASWPGFALALAALLSAAGRRLGVVAAALAIAAFGIGAAKMQQARFKRPDTPAVARFIDRAAAPGDVVVDGTVTSPAGIPGALSIALGKRHRVLELGRTPVRYEPFRIVGSPLTTAQVLDRAVAAAHDRRIFVVVPASLLLVQEARGETPNPFIKALIEQVNGPLSAAGYRAQAARSFPGVIGLGVNAFARRAG
jgi:Dolichyl-phosphate-mannose-protein mannosyltransferase